MGRRLRQRYRMAGRHSFVGRWLRLLPWRLRSLGLVETVMKISARNVLKGRVTRIIDGAVNCEVTLEIAPGIEVVSIITKASVESLELAVGSTAYAVIKASSVMVAIE
jgi:molybdopterin-binding protein